MTHFFEHNEPFFLESGERLSNLRIAYTTLGTINKAKDNVIWICHALTANSNPAEWWDVLVGEGKVFDPNQYFIVCANMLGSCYGSTNALSINPETEKAYFHEFPFFTIRDIVNSLDLLRVHLSISKIKLCIGGSMGGQQAMEWAISKNEVIENLALIATNAKHSAWGIAFNQSQRLAIENDPTWKNEHACAGLDGMKVARSIALLSYRNYEAYTLTQTDNDDRKDGFSSSSYQTYQGEKLANRFDAFAYYNLSKAMDSHNVGRNRASVADALSQITATTSVISISNDVLFPPSEQQFLATHIPKATYHEILSPYGHDGFLLEGDSLNQILQHDFSFLKQCYCVKV